MIGLSVSTLQAMAGRFLTATDLHAWESASQKRLTELVRQFQRKELDPNALHAALSTERVGPATSSPAPGAVAVLPLMGVLSPGPSLFSLLGFGTSIRGFIADLHTLSVDPKIKAVVILADTPGGSVRLIPEAAAAMRHARARKPVIVSVAGVAASAGYWIASNATALEVTPSGSVGAIGIITERVSIARQLEHQGVDVHVISAGKYKAENHEAIPITDDERQALQRRVDAAYGTFVGDVAAGRHVPTGEVRNGFGEGRLVDASEALRLGMIDRIANVEATVARVLADPHTLTALMTRRIEQMRASTDRARIDRASAEIGAYRARFRHIAAR